MDLLSSLKISSSGLAATKKKIWKPILLTLRMLKRQGLPKVVLTAGKKWYSVQNRLAKLFLKFWKGNSRRMLRQFMLLKSCTLIRLFLNMILSS